MAAKSRLQAASAILLVAVMRKKQKKRRKNRCVWTRKWILNRDVQGAYNHLLKELELMDTSNYRNFIRMDAATFEELLHIVAPKITYTDTVMRQAISPGERLAVTLRFWLQV